MTDLKKLAYESPASQDGWEVWQMLRHVAEINPKVIVEIGVDGGGFMHTLELAFPEATIIGIEISKRRELDRYKIIYGDSQAPGTVGKLALMLGARPIDFLFIDGDHHYEAVKSEYELYKDLVRPGGIIGFHDTNNRGIEGVEVDRFLAELDQAQSYRVADYRTDRFSPGTRLTWT